MGTTITAQPIEMIPARRQTLWGWPAVANFALGGLGAGFYAVALLAAGFERSSGVAVASWAAPALVLAGFAAVAGEAGRPLRGPRVLARLWTSWMSRELLIGGAFVLLVAADLAFPLRLHRAQALAAALLLALAQGFIVRRSRGVTAWDVPIVPLLFLLSALVSGAGAALLVEAAGRRPVDPALPAIALVLVVATSVAWARYLSWSSHESFARAIAPLREGYTALLVAGAGHALPLVLVGLALLVPLAAAPALGLAGALLIAGQVYAKARFILAAGQLRPITLAIAPSRRRSP
jgi:formate-dependent nitrite reductase membrane component NrfD